MKKSILFIVVAGIILAAGFTLNQNFDKAAEEQAVLDTKNAKEAEVKLMEGFKQTDIVIGRGVEAKIGSTVVVNYRGRIQKTGQEFDNSYKSGTPITLTLGAGEVIKGWEIGLLGMKVGGVRKLSVPPALAYGSQGKGSIPPDAVLDFDVELVEVR